MWTPVSVSCACRVHGVNPQPSGIAATPAKKQKSGLASSSTAEPELQCKKIKIGKGKAPAREPEPVAKKNKEKTRQTLMEDGKKAKRVWRYAPEPSTPAAGPSSSIYASPESMRDAVRSAEIYARMDASADARRMRQAVELAGLETT